MGPNRRDDAIQLVDRYVVCVLGIDWGRGGEEETSFTTYAVVGLLPDGRLECFYGFRSLTPFDHFREAAIARDMASVFQCRYIAHDFSGAGTTARRSCITPACRWRTSCPSTTGG